LSIPLRTRTYESHVVVALHGDLDVVDADSAAAAVAACGPRVIVDLSALEFADCYALGALLRVQQAARAAGGDVRLAAPRQLVLRVLDLPGLAGMFCVYPSVAAADASDARRSAKDAGPQLAASTAPPGTAAPSGTATGDGCGAGSAGG
jgi:anti-sigma B factor antagonist